MPVHAGADAAPTRPGQGGSAWFTLTNSVPGNGSAVLARAGLAHHFERSFSVAPAGTFKPVPQTCRGVMDAPGAPADASCLAA
ncbi:hypothetical protein [uncultured Jannaschia sp.]|uniref:hypothetical protein n=1 Tax=uncultured Jannaschia sp. TaxID=293347 RepID=UPI00261BAA7F|nr:hypothetical protein [uncultured Jannaschia sp.]